MCGSIQFRKALYSNPPSPASARTWMPDLMKEYDDLQLKLLGLNIFIRTVFPGSPFFATTLNMGPQTVCFAHRDYWNLLYGTCGIGALGPFDHRTGGHLILHEPKVIMEFRRGDVIWVPSAAVTHENVPIKPHETRYSFTMYTAGGLFRYAWCGGMTAKDMKQKDKVTYQRYLSEGDSRRKQGWDLYSTMDSLVASLKSNASN